MRLVELDALRGMAVLLVLVYHYTTRVHELYPEVIPPFSFPWGLYGVDLFFVISGFVISLTLEKTTRWQEFVRSRFRRLFPSYWMANCITFAAISVFGLPGRDISFAVFVANLTMLQNWFSLPSTDGAYWSLFIELCFYLLMGILTFRFSALRGSLPYVLLAYVGWMLGGYYLTALQVVSIPKPLGNLLFLGFYGHLFVAGICFYELYRRRTPKVQGAVIMLCGFCQILMRDTESVPVVAVSFLFFWLFINKKLSWLARNPLLFLGEISYCLYLIHQNVGYVIMRYMNDLTQSWAISALVATGAVVLLAAVLTYRFEQPIGRRLRKFQDEQVNARAAA